MRVLVDTSVWIRFLAGREPHATGLDRLLRDDEVVAHELVFAELLIGDRGGRAKLLREYQQFVQAPTVSHEDAVSFVRERGLNGTGLGWIDANLIASALVGGFSLWTADARFAAVVDEIGVAYSPHH